MRCVFAPVALLLLSLARSADSSSAVIETLGTASESVEAELCASDDQTLQDAASQCNAVKKAIQEQYSIFIDLVAQWASKKLEQRRVQLQGTDTVIVKTINHTVDAAFNAYRRVEQEIEEQYKSMEMKFETCTQNVVKTYMQYTTTIDASSAIEESGDAVEARKVRLSFEIQFITEELANVNMNFISASEMQLVALSRSITAWTEIGMFLNSLHPAENERTAQLTHITGLVKQLYEAKIQYLNTTFAKLKAESYRNATRRTLAMLQEVQDGVAARQVSIQLSN